MTKYEWWKVLLLSIVTCGIYYLFVQAKMTEEHNAKAAQLGIPEVKNFWIAFLLGIVTCSVYMYIWLYKYNEQNVKILNAQGSKAAPTETPILLLLLGFVPVYGYYVIIDNHNRING